MKKKLLLMLRFFVVLTGIIILIYPSVSEFLAEKNGSRATASYNDTVQQMTQAHISELIQQAQEYNQKLAEMTTGIADAGEPGTNYTPEDYWSLMNIDSSGMMGYIEIPSLNISLPIYHGTDESVLQVGIGHMQNTSLPVGGASTHAVLSGHRGLPTNDLFTNLDKMQIGDKFFITTFNQTLCYTVDRIQTVLPYEVDALTIEAEKDYVTLVTCTPYGVNSHRLLIRGTRTPYDPIEKNEIETEHSRWELLPAQYRHLIVGLVFVGMVILTKYVWGRAILKNGQESQAGKTIWR